MEEQKLLKRKQKQKKNKRKKKSQDLQYQNKISFYYYNILNFPRINCLTIIFCCLIIFFLIKLYYYKTDVNNDFNLKNKIEELIDMQNNINNTFINNKNNFVINESNANNKIDDNIKIEDSEIINELNISNINEIKEEENKEIKIKENNLKPNNKSGINEDEEELMFEEEEEEIDKKKKRTDKNMTDIIKNVNKYIYNCLNDILIDGIKKSSGNPKISTVTASYNSEKTIRATIRSIQNQNMSDIEIIIVDDGSKDNTLNIIKELQKEDERIKIIENKENMGPLYSKSIGALNAKGKYIMSIDSDDLFINENIFDICYNESKKNNIDILEFSGFRSVKKYLGQKARPPLYLCFKKDQLTVKQPELSTFIYRKYYKRINRLIDGYLWGKCIRTVLYKKALDLISEDTYKIKLYYGDDRLVNFVLFRIANSFKFIEEYGIIYYSTPHSILNSYKKQRNSHDELINIWNIYNFTKNSSDAEIAAFEFRARWKRLISPGLNEENRKIARKMLRQMLKCKFINKNSRRKIYILWTSRNKK